MTPSQATADPDLEAQVHAVVDDLRPFINMDGGDVEVIHIDGERGVVTVRLYGACDTCSMSQITLKAGLEARLREQVPGIHEVVHV